MRVAVHLPSGHPEHGDPDNPETVVVAYRLGRIREGIDNLILHTGELVPLDKFVAGLITQARAEFPAAEVKLERLVQKADKPDEGEWIPAESFNPDQHTPVGAGASTSKDLHVVAEQTTGGAE